MTPNEQVEVAVAVEIDGGCCGTGLVQVARNYCLTCGSHQCCHAHASYDFPLAEWRQANPEMIAQAARPTQPGANDGE